MAFQGLTKLVLSDIGRKNR